MSDAEVLTTDFSNLHQSKGGNDATEFGSRFRQVWNVVSIPPRVKVGRMTIREELHHASFRVAKHGNNQFC